MQQHRGQFSFGHVRHNTSVKRNIQLSLEKVRKHLLPKKLHLRTDVDIENPATGPPTNKHAQSTKNKSSFKRYSREKSEISSTGPSQGYLLLQSSHKPSKRHSLKETQVHSISINKSTFLGRKGSTTNNNSIDKIVKKQDLSPYRNSLTKYRSSKAAEMFRTKHPSGNLRRPIEKLKTQQSRDRDEQVPAHKQSTVKTTPQSYNRLATSMRPKDVLGKHASHLSMFEQAEILEYEMVYFLSKNPPRENKGDDNLGFDDKKGHYLCSIHDHVAYRYEVLEELGRGSFGQVHRAYDHKIKCHVALKIIKNKRTPNSQAKIEYGLLRYIKEADEDNCVNVVHVRQAFQYRKHFCMTFEILSHNLYELIKLNKFMPLSSELIRRISIQVLSTLLFLYKHDIVHCDIKPQNILLKSSDKSGIKIIDFGSSCFSDQKLYTYIQSRYYRAPEVILGYDYSTEIDIWSFACVAAELKLSYPIFSGENEDEQVGLIAEVIGLPEPAFYQNTERGKMYFGEGASPLKDRDNIEIEPKTRLLTNLFADADFADFLSRIFVWDPKERITPLEALRHKWIMKGLPTEIRQQHMQYLAEQQQHIQEILKKRALLRERQRVQTQGQTFSEELLVGALRSIE